MVMFVCGMGKGFGIGSKLELLDVGLARTSGASLSTRVWLRLAMSGRIIILAIRAILCERETQGDGYCYCRLMVQREVLTADWQRTRMRCSLHIESAFK